MSTSFDIRRPRDAAAFARMLRRAASGIDRALAQRPARGAAPVRPQPAATAPARAGDPAGKGPPAAPVWPDAALHAPPRTEAADAPVNPWEVLKASSRAQERAAGQLLASRASKPSRK